MRGWFKLVLGFLVGLIWGFVVSAHAATPPYDSVQQKVIDGIIDDGMILVPAGTTDPVPFIRTQLRYMLGQLNWWDAAPRVSWFKIQVGKSETWPDSPSLTLVHYQAQGHVAWSIDQDDLDHLMLYLPARGDAEGLDEFTSLYFHDCINDPHADEDGFYFFFFPELDSCPMSSSSAGELKREKGNVFRMQMRFRENNTNTEDKSPEYGKIWEDHKLVATVIFGKYDVHGTTTADEGILAYDTFYSRLLNAYGSPALQAEEEGQAVEGSLTRNLRPLKLVWKRSRGTIEVHLALIPSVATAGDAFWDWYQRRTQDSDVVMYDGHAGLGDNIETLAGEAKFVPKKYQIFFVNGCDTFTYVNEKLFAAHGAATPGAPVSKYLDIITNSASNYFNQMSNESFALLDALVNEKLTYHEILQKFDPRQRSIVDGEEDNTWPDPFVEYDPLQAGQQFR